MTPRYPDGTQMRPSRHEKKNSVPSRGRRPDNVKVLRHPAALEVRVVPMSRFARFVVLYYSHVLTTIPVPDLRSIAQRDRESQL